jgi:hypothetical protein
LIKDYLKELTPFEPYPEPEKYPLLDLKNGTKPRWYFYEQDSIRKRKHQYSIIPYKYSKNAHLNKTKELIKNMPYQQQ